jgi:UV DNA damage endonuclease
MTKKIGFACKFMNGDQTLSPKILKEIEGQYNSNTTTISWLSRQSRNIAEEKLWNISLENSKKTYNLVKYVSELPEELRMVRISSDQCPAYTHNDWKYFYKQADVIRMLETQWKKVGDLARDRGVRLSFHPGQFTVLASDNPEIVERSIEEFEYHVDVIRWMGYGRSFQDFKCNVHISGRQGPAGIKNVLSRLSPEARNCITIENDENSWGLDASLELERDLALVVDIHHHWIRTGEYIQPTDDRYLRVIDSWRGVRPVIHYSYSRDEHLPADFDHNDLPDMKTLLEQGHKKQKLRAHSDYYPNSVANQWALSFLETADIMAESKAKNLSSISLYNYAVKTGVVQGSAYTHRDPASSTSSEYLAETLPDAQLQQLDTLVVA